MRKTKEKDIFHYWKQDRRYKQMKFTHTQAGGTKIAVRRPLTYVARERVRRLGKFWRWIIVLEGQSLRAISTSLPYQPRQTSYDRYFFCRLGKWNGLWRETIRSVNHCDESCIMCYCVKKGKSYRSDRCLLEVRQVSGTYSPCRSLTNKCSNNFPNKLRVIIWNTCLNNSLFVREPITNSLEFHNDWSIRERRCL